MQGFNHLNKNQQYMDSKSRKLRLKEKLETLSRLIREQLQEDPLSAIDHDLALQKTREIYDLLLQLNQSDPTDAGQEPVIETQPEAVSSVTVEAEIQESETDTSEIDTSEIVSPVADAGEQERPEKPETIKEEPDLFTTSAPSTPEPPDKKSASKEAIGDIFSESKPKETIADKMQKDKINSLKVAIGINDKFYFINELFDGNLNDYSKAIDDLDTAGSPDEAQNIVAGLQSQYNWDPKSEAYQQLSDFVKRKFS